MRTFVLSDYTSYKFWNIHLQGDRFTVEYGKVGSKGQQQTKEFANEEKAQSAAEKLINEKLNKGYIETTSPATADPKRLAFECEILDNPDDLSTYAAYADYLNEQGDPQGEFMQVQIALENENFSAQERKELQQRESQLVNQHQKEWVGKWIDSVTNDPSHAYGYIPFPKEVVQFHRGIPTTLTIDQLNVASARALVRSPETRMVQDLRIGYFAFEEEGEYDAGADLEGLDDPYQPSAAVLAHWPFFENLRIFQLGRTPEENYDDYCSFSCHLSAWNVQHLIKRMPRLEELYLFAHRTESDVIFRFSMPNLRVLQVYHTWNYPLTDLAKNKSLTNLTHLLCHPHALEYDEEPYINLNDLKAIVQSKHLKSLTHLRLRLANFGDDGIKEIVKSGILKRLKVLDLRHGCVSDAGAKMLAECPDFQHLEFLDLSRNDLTEEGLNALKQTGVGLDTSYPNNPDNDDDPDTRDYLFQGDIE